MNATDSLRLACEMISRGDKTAAADALSRAFPKLLPSTTRSAWPKARLVREYVRHGFTDRYFSDPLIFPGTLRALSFLAPELVPYHRNWKQSATHALYWTHYPTLDHVTPIARGGFDVEENTVITSMLHNSAKANWLPAELSWRNGDAPVLPNWDGLLPWFMREYERNDLLRQQQTLSDWYRAAKVAA